MQHLSPVYKVPANSSRFFNEYSEAITQPLGIVQLAWDETNQIIVNQEYIPELIKYDSQYCTSVSAIGTKYTSPTLNYFNQILKYIKDSAMVIDIGCGQGEFVNELRRRNINAIGFDPVLRVSSPYLRAKYWEPSDRVGDLYVLRCVLPHIQNPWNFLAEISFSAPGALVLIEFQRIEWILENKIWYQVSHDHVNLFSLRDFILRYDVLDSGKFSNGEWGWVLIDPSTFHLPESFAPDIYELNFKELFDEKNSYLNYLKLIDRQLVIWGAAGKGIVLAHASMSYHHKIVAIDADSHRWGYFLEASGVEVLPPHAAARMDEESLILVCNPNHLEQVKQFIGDRMEVKLPSDLS